MKGKAGIVAGAITGLALVLAPILDGLYVREGGYVNHKNDRGGATRYGITEAVARSWGYRGDMRKFPKHCDDRNPVCADKIYRVTYIEKPGFLPFAAMSPAVLEELVDSAVLHGPSKPGLWLQKSLNNVCDAALVVDGKVGPKTVEAYDSCRRRYGDGLTCFTVLEDLDDQQHRYFDEIVARNPSQRVFYKGWTSKRLNNVDRRKCFR